MSHGLGQALLTGAFITVLVVLTLVITIRCRRTTEPSEYYVAAKTFGGRQNGLALLGAFLMFTSFLTMTGEIALKGFDGFLFATGFAVSWLVMLLLVAGPMRNTGRFTLGDILTVRMKERPARAAAATVTLVVFFFYMMVQLVGASRLAMTIFGISGPSAQAFAIIVVGGLTTVCVAVGGMRATTGAQVVKAVLLLVGVALLAALVLAAYRLNVSALLGDVAERGGGDRLLLPGMKFQHGQHKLEFVSQLVTVVAGHAALPYLFMRFNTVSTAREARRSVAWGTWLIGPYYLLVVIIGFGVTALLGTGVIPSPTQRDSAALLLAGELGGPLLVAFLGAVVLLTVVTVTAGLMISATASFTHDIYSNVIRKGRIAPQREVVVARRTAVALGLFTVICGLLFMRQNISFMLSLDVTVVASTVLPTLLYSWFWRRFNTAGVLWSMYGGLALTVVLVAFSPAVSGNPVSMLPGLDFSYFPWKYVGLVSIPAAFLLGYLGTVLSSERDDGRFAEMEVRALTGIGSPSSDTRSPDGHTAAGDRVPERADAG